MSDYQQQDRSSSAAYDEYYAGMDKGMQQKVAMTSAFFLFEPNSVIADMGSGSGAASDTYAKLFPELKVIGIDINRKAITRSKKTYKRKNLSFRVGDVEQNVCGNESLDAILHSSTLHHVYSFNDYNTANVHNCIANQVAQLKEDGIFLLRDFVSPSKNTSVLLRLHKPDEQQRLLDFSRTARSMEKHRLNGFFLEELSNDLFRLNAHDMAEFVLRKDYIDDWEVELKEQYCYFTQEEFEDAFAQHGLRVLVSAPYVNPWIVENRFKDSFELFSENEERLYWPATNYMIAGEKTTGGIRIREHSISQKRACFLKERFYVDSHGQHHHVISRPGQAHDVLPYFLDGDSTYVLVKHAYPRPLINTERRGSPNIDQKRFAGYVTESLCGIGDLDDVLNSAGISNYHNCKKQAHYFTAPEYLDEKVESSFVELDSMIATTAMPKQTDFEDSGKLKMLSIQDVLRSAQVGSLPDARLELQCYRLLRWLQKPIDPWIGSIPVAHELRRLGQASDKLKLSFTEKLQKEQSSFRVNRSLFQEEGFRDGTLTHLHSSELEFVTPLHGSSNTVSYVYLQQSQGKYYINVAYRAFPSIIQHQEDHKIYSVFNQRLPKNVSNFQQLEEYTLSHSEVGKCLDGMDFQLLGNGYFSSIGVSPEKVYPAVISARSSFSVFHSAATWFSLEELLFNENYMRDVNLAVIFYRLIHSLGLWEEYFCKK